VEGIGVAECFEQTEAEIARRLGATLAPGSPNEITASQLQEWAIEYLREHDQEVATYPDCVGEPHWNLWMMDARFEDALFAVLVFEPGGVAFVCGTGDALAIKRFAESDFPDAIEQLPAELSRLFAAPAGVLHLDRDAAEDWLGRGWQ
jgi:hypothetical protein